MNGRPLTDAQIAQALRAHLPERAAAGLRERVLDQAATDGAAATAAVVPRGPERRRPASAAAEPSSCGGPPDRAHAGGRRGCGRLAPAAAREADPLSLEPPPNVDAYVTGAYEGLVDLPALTFTVVQVEGPRRATSTTGIGSLYGTMRHPIRRDLRGPPCSPSLSFEKSSART